MKYRPELGLWGNIKIALEEITKTNNSVSAERSDRQTADTENRESVEQAITDLYLDGIQAQQDITSAYLEIAELKSV